MPQCVVFDYFGIDCEKQSVSKQGKQGAHILRQFGGPKKYNLTIGGDECPLVSPASQARCSTYGSTVLC